MIIAIIGIDLGNVPEPTLLSRHHLVLLPISDLERRESRFLRQRQREFPETSSYWHGTAWRLRAHRTARWRALRSRR